MAVTALHKKNIAIFDSTMERARPFEVHEFTKMAMTRSYEKIIAILDDINDTDKVEE